MPPTSAVPKSTPSCKTQVPRDALRFESIDGLRGVASRPVKEVIEAEQLGYKAARPVESVN